MTTGTPAADFDAVLAWAAALMRLEFDAVVAKHGERATATYRSRRERFEENLSSGVESELDRPDPVDDAWLDTGKRIIDSGGVRPRIVFQVKAYMHPVWGSLYRVYASAMTCPPGGCTDYAVNLFCATHRGTFRVVARYDLDTLPQPGVRILENGVSWIRHSGDELQTMGVLTAVRKLKAPRKVEHLREFEAE